MTQKDNQTASQFANQDIVETLPTTAQQSISPKLPTITTPHNKNNTPFWPKTLQSTVKSSVISKYRHMDYQTYKPITKQRLTKKPKYTNGDSFANHNYNNFHKWNDQQSVLTIKFYAA